MMLVRSVTKYVSYYFITCRYYH